MSAAPPDSHPEKGCVSRSFDAAAASYDGVAGLQRAVGQALLSRWPDRIGALGTILDAGAGTGYFAAELSARCPGARLIALDIADNMLRVAWSRLGARETVWYVCGDIEALPVASRSVDMIFSNLAIQWCPDLYAVFGEFRRVLRPGGGLLFSTFGPATLGELRRAWAMVDGYSHVNEFVVRDEIGAVLNRAGFGEVILSEEIRVLEYRDVWSLMRELKALGAHNVTAGRARHLTGKDALHKMLDAYGAQTEAGGVRASFEIICGYANVGGSAP